MRLLVVISSRLPIAQDRDLGRREFYVNGKRLVRRRLVPTAPAEAKCFQRAPVVQPLAASLDQGGQMDAHGTAPSNMTQQA